MKSFGQHRSRCHSLQRRVSAEPLTLEDEAIGQSRIDPERQRELIGVDTIHVDRVSGDG